MEFLTRKEVAEYLRVHERTVDRWIESGSLGAYKLGTGKTALLRIPKSEVEKFLSANNSKINVKKQK
jgi:excisionase family DNA binding protein